MTVARRQGCLRSNLSGTRLTSRALSSSHAQCIQSTFAGEDMNIRCLLAVLLLLIACAAVSAQPSDANKTAAKTAANPAKSAKDPEAERLMKERRDNAQALLMSLAADAGRFNDQTLRAR